MAEKDIIQTQISRLGQSQQDRFSPELEPGFVSVDERSGADLLAQARLLAPHIRFYRHTHEYSAGNWSDFFPTVSSAADDQHLLEGETGDVPPHLGLFGAFLHLYRHPQQALNTITERHLDFQFRQVLRFEPKPAQPDHVHVILELKKGTAPLAITPDYRFSAGKDASGGELLYQPVRESLVGQGKVDALHSIFHSNQGLYFAPVANSSDGLGGELLADHARWPAFGNAKLPPAHVGFALASPLLRLQEGTRTLRIDLQLSAINAQKHTASALAAALEAYVTGPKGWHGPLNPEAALAGNTLSLSFVIPETAPAVIDYDVNIHGHAFATSAPVIQLHLKPEASLHVEDISSLSVGTAQIYVEVEGLKTVSLENDSGSLNPKKAFLPFGPQPVPGSRFMIGCEEALSKNLIDLTVSLTWQGAPANFTSWYNNYSNVNKIKDGISASLLYQDRSGQRKSAVVDIMKRDSAGTSVLSVNAPPPSAPLQDNKTDSRLFALFSAGSRISRLLGRRITMAKPIHKRPRIRLNLNVVGRGSAGETAVPAPQVRSGYITLALTDDFLHADYRYEAIQHAMKQDKIVLNEPYTPTVQAMSLSYKAQSEAVDVSAVDQESFTSLDVQFFHVGCFGQRREHAYLRQQLSYLQEKRIGLIADFSYEGEFLIGLTGVNAGDAVSLLIQVAEGSANPDVPPQRLEWSVLCDNYWRLLSPQERVIDTTNECRTSGIVTIVLPREASTENTWMPDERVWLRATVSQYSAAVCEFIHVATNAVELRFVDQGNDPRHLVQALPEGSIAKLKVLPSFSGTMPAAIKSISQPYASFGGSPQETNSALRKHASERLRHRQRCITPWDYERMLLEAFPHVHKVKCIPHASEQSWLAPGHVMLVVIPDLRNQNANDRLQPRVDIDTLTRMATFAQQHCGMQVALHVKNPRYQRVRLDFNVRFHAGFAFNYYSQQLHEAIIRKLSPWAYASDASDDVSPQALEFGGRLYRSVLLDFIEELPYVDFVTNFKMGVVPDGALPMKDVAEISADTPDTILVSNATHSITEVLDS
ncbi:MAG: hypothetical protein V4525_16115 [Pseudomonadota bacterium]